MDDQIFDALTPVVNALDEIKDLLSDIRENTAMLVNNSDELKRSAPRWVNTLDSSLSSIAGEVAALPGLLDL